MERNKNNSLNAYFACVIVLFAANAVWLKYYKHLVIPADLTVQVTWIGNFLEYFGHWCPS